MKKIMKKTVVSVFGLVFLLSVGNTSAYADSSVANASKVSVVEQYAHGET